MRLAAQMFPRFGKRHWDRLLQLVIEQTAHNFNWDFLYLGGNTRKISFTLPKNEKIVSIEEGLLGARCRGGK